MNIRKPDKIRQTKNKSQNYHFIDYFVELVMPSNKKMKRNQGCKGYKKTSVKKH